MQLIIAALVTHVQVSCQSGNYEILSIRISEYSFIQILLRSYWIVIICQSLAKILLPYRHLEHSDVFSARGIFHFMDWLEAKNNRTIKVRTLKKEHLGHFHFLHSIVERENNRPPTTLLVITI